MIRLNHPSHKKSGSVVTALIRLIGVFDSMNIPFNAGVVAKFWARCQISSVPGADEENVPRISDGLYLYSAYRS